MSPGEGFWGVLSWLKPGFAFFPWNSPQFPLRGSLRGGGAAPAPLRSRRGERKFWNRFDFLFIYSPHQTPPQARSAPSAAGRGGKKKKKIEFSPWILPRFSPSPNGNFGVEKPGFNNGNYSQFRSVGASKALRWSLILGGEK